MRKVVLLIFCLAWASCAKVESTSDKKSVLPVNSSTVTEIAPLKPVNTNITLNKSQTKYLDDSLPPNVREILEKAEKFEVLAEIRVEGERDGEGTTFEPNRIARIANDKDKKEILEAFFYDVARETEPAACYEPHHSIKASFQNKNVEVEICFSCSRFVVKSDFGKFEGTISRENPKSEKILEQIVKTKAIEIKN